MIARSFRSDHSYRPMPAVSFIIGHQKIRIPFIEPKADVKSRQAAFFIFGQSLDNTPRTTSGSTFVVRELTLFKQVVSAHITACNLDAEELSLIHKAMLSRYGQWEVGCAVLVFSRHSVRYISQLTLFPSGYLCQETSSWEQRKLGDCGTTYGGLSGKTKEDFGHGEARFVPYTNVFDNPIADTCRLEAIEIDPRQNEVKLGDALFTISSETPEEVGMSSVWLSEQPNVYLNSFCFGYRQDGSFDSLYLAYMLRSQGMRSKLALLAQGISRFNISKKRVMELEAPRPRLEEQRKIGALFQKLDSLITLHQREPQFTDMGYMRVERALMTMSMSLFSSS